MSKKDINTLLNDIEMLFDTDKILSRNTEDANQIAKYYRINRLAYDLFNSSAGFVHMGISYNGRFNKRDFYEQGNIVSRYIEKNSPDKILELAPGKAATTAYLAKKYPSSVFYGLDLPGGQLNSKKYNKINNLQLVTGDYHDLTTFKENSFGVVYIIEALCHSHNKAKVINEAYRVLHPGGFFIIFDGYFNKPESQLTPAEIKASKLLFTSMMVKDSGHGYDSLTSDIKKSKFKIIESQDLSNNIMPSLNRLESYAKHYFKHKKSAKIASKVLPDEFTANAIAGYLFSTMVMQGIFSYKLTISQKV